MVTLFKITWQDFQEMVRIIREYKKQSLPEDSIWFDEVLKIFSKVKKQNYNITIDDLKKEDLYRIITIIDM